MLMGAYPDHPAFSQPDPARYHTRIRFTLDGRYFYIPARQEHRGVGGIFFDDLSSAEVGYDVEAFTRDVGEGILPSWLPIVAANRDLPFTEAQRDWQVGAGQCFRGGYSITIVIKALCSGPGKVIKDMSGVPGNAP